MRTLTFYHQYIQTLAVNDILLKMCGALNCSVISSIIIRKLMFYTSDNQCAAGTEKVSNSVFHVFIRVLRLKMV